MQLTCFECAEHMPAGRSSAGCGTGFMQWKTCETGPGRVVFINEGFQTLTFPLPEEGLNCVSLFPVCYGYLATWKKTPRFIIQKAFKMNSVMQGASRGQNPFDTRSILTEREKNHLLTAVWMIQMLQFLPES